MKKMNEIKIIHNHQIKVKVKYYIFIAKTFFRFIKYTKGKKMKFNGKII